MSFVTWLGYPNACLTWCSKIPETQRQHNFVLIVLVSKFSNRQAHTSPVKYKILITASVDVVE